MRSQLWRWAARDTALGCQLYTVTCYWRPQAPLRAACTMRSTWTTTDGGTKPRSAGVWLCLSLLVAGTAAEVYPLRRVLSLLDSSEPATPTTQSPGGQAIPEGLLSPLKEELPAPLLLPPLWTPSDFGLVAPGSRSSQRALMFHNGEEEYDPDPDPTPSTTGRKPLVSVMNNG